MRHLAVAFALLTSLWSLSAQASTVYFVDINFGPQFDEFSSDFLGNGRLTGTIVTDGTVGGLTDSNFLGWSFTYGVPGVVSQTIDSNGIAGDARVLSGGSVLFADGTDLTLGALTAQFDSLEFGNGLLFFSISRSAANPTNNFLIVGLPFSSPVPNDLMFAELPQNTVVGSVPVPAALPLALTGLAVLGLLGRRRRLSSAVV